MGILNIARLQHIRADIYVAFVQNNLTRWVDVRLVHPAFAWCNINPQGWLA